MKIDPTGRRVVSTGPRRKIKDARGKVVKKPRRKPKPKGKR